MRRVGLGRRASGSGSGSGPSFLENRRCGHLSCERPPLCLAGRTGCTAVYGSVKRTASAWTFPGSGYYGLSRCEAVEPRHPTESPPPGWPKATTAGTSHPSDAQPRACAAVGAPPGGSPGGSACRPLPPGDLVGDPPGSAASATGAGARRGCQHAHAAHLHTRLTSCQSHALAHPHALSRSLQIPLTSPLLGGGRITAAQVHGRVTIVLQPRRGTLENSVRPPARRQTGDPHHHPRVRTGHSRW